MLPPRKLLPIEELPSSGAVEEEEEEEDTNEYPPFEPLVLWSHPEDSTKKIEVIPQLACRLRPHQREGVQFLFECTMGLRGFEGEVNLNYFSLFLYFISLLNISLIIIFRVVFLLMIWVLVKL